MPLPEAWQFEALGTRWRIATNTSLAGETRQHVLSLIGVFDQAYSRFRDDSIVTQLARQGGTHVFDESLRFKPLWQLYEALYEATGGAMTPLVGRALEDAGYDKNYQLHRPAHTTAIPPLHEVVSWDGGSKLTMKRPALLDLGAAGKGLLVDMVRDLLVAEGMTECVVDGSGDLAHQARRPYVAGLEHPADASKIIGTVKIKNESLSGSATNRRAWEGFHHVIDGRTGVPTRDIIATWVICSDTMTADALTTALFFLKTPDQLMERYKAAYLRIGQSGTIMLNERMKARVTLYT